MPSPTTARLRRPRVLLALAVAAVLGVTALALTTRGEPVRELHGGAAAAAPTSAPRVATTTSPAPAPGRAAAALAAGVATDTAGVLEVAVLDLATGEAALGPRADVPLYSASMSKLLVAVDVLDQRATGAVTLDAADLELVADALGPSDDGAMNALWSTFDGIGGVARVAQRLGLTATTAPDDASEWGAVTTSAADLVAVYRHVVDDLPAADSRLLLTALDAATPEAADGFDQGFGLLAVGGTSTKQGWACCYAGTVALHSAGILAGRYAVAVMSAVPRSAGYAGARTAVDAAAAATAAVLA